RLAELAPYFGVFDGQVQDCLCRAERVSCPGDRHVIDQRLDGVGRCGTQTLRGRLVEPYTKSLAGLVDSGLRGDVDAGCRRLDREKARAVSIVGEHQDQVGCGGIRHAVDLAAQHDTVAAWDRGR